MPKVVWHKKPTGAYYETINKKPWGKFRREPMDIREQASNSPTPSRWRRTPKKLIVLVICLVCCVAAASFLSMDKEVTIYVNGQAQQVSTSKTKVADILQENNIAICEGDLVEPELSEKVANHATISVTRAFDFSVFADEEKIILRSTPLSVQEALDMAGVTLGEMDQVSMPLDTIISTPKKVIVARVDVEYVKREVVIAAPVETRRDDSVAEGQTKVIKAGSDGLKKEVLAIYTKDGQELTRKVTESTVVKEAEKRIVAQGAMKVASRSGSSTNSKTAVNTSSSPSLAGKETKYVKAYAYTGGGKTHLGTNARYGVIAVDPSVIPLGTKVYVEGYGYATAEDTGGNIKGNTIDLYMDSSSACYNWGIKTVKIYILD